MLSMRQLSVAIDSMQKDRNKLGNKVKAEVMNSFVFGRYMDSSWKFTPEKVKAKTFSQLVPDSIKSYVHERIVGKLNNAVVSNQVVIDQDVPQKKSLWGYKVEWHKKLMLSFSCIVMFLIGAPLGSIIRKGGLGSPLIFAIIFFMLFYFSSTGGEKAAREGSLSPFTGMWLSSFILLPIGFFLTYNAMRDSQLFNKEWYYRFWRKLRRKA